MASAGRIMANYPTYAHMNRLRNFSIKKEKHIPCFLGNVVALPPRTPTMKGVLEWLKTERLHKYWPLFSRLTYTTLVHLNEANFDRVFSNVGSHYFTQGARGRILRCSQRLRSRLALLSEIDCNSNIETIVNNFNAVLSTPLTNDPVPNGRTLLELLRRKLTLVVAIHRDTILANPTFRTFLKKYASREEIPRNDRHLAVQLLAKTPGDCVIPRTVSRRGSQSTRRSLTTTESTRRIRHLSLPGVDRSSTPNTESSVSRGDSSVIENFSELFERMALDVNCNVTKWPPVEDKSKNDFKFENQEASKKLEDEVDGKAMNNDKNSWGFDNDKYWKDPLVPFSGRTKSTIGLWSEASTDIFNDYLNPSNLSDYKNWRSSSAFSHLWSQSTVSGPTLPIIDNDLLHEKPQMASTFNPVVRRRHEPLTNWSETLMLPSICKTKPTLENYCQTSYLSDRKNMRSCSTFSHPCCEPTVSASLPKIGNRLYERGQITSTSYHPVERRQEAPRNRFSYDFTPSRIFDEYHLWGGTPNEVMVKWETPRM